MISAPSDPSTGNQGEASPAAVPAGNTAANTAGDTPNFLASGMPGGNPEPASAAAGASADRQEPQADPFAQRLHEHETSQRKQWQEQVDLWRKEVTEDPQIGGANLPTTVARAQLALDRFDDGKRIGQLLEQTGYGNNPDVLRFFNRLADALMEDGLVQGHIGGAMPPLEERMYAGWSSRSGRA